MLHGHIVKSISFNSRSNFVRVCVVEVVESCGRHLDKLINVDEFLRRITTVMHSNDPVSYNFVFLMKRR